MTATPHRVSGKARRRTALAVASVTASLVLTACGGSGSSNPQGSGTPGKGASGKAVAGNTLTVGELQPPNSLDPAIVDQNPDFIQMPYEPLIYLDSEGTLQPALATKWAMTDSNKRLQLTLRSGVKFSDGSAVTPAAVKASLEYAQGAGGINAQYLAGATITVSGQDQVVITLTKPNPLLPTLLTQEFGVGAIISPTGLKNPKLLTAAATSQGAGPYIYDPKNSVAGDHYTYNANPNYYDPSRQHYKKIVMKIVGDPSTAVNALSTHELDVFTGDYSAAAQAKAAGLQVISADSLWLGLTFYDRSGAVSKPLGDVRVRQAINYAIDRDAIAKAVLGDYGSPAQQIFASNGEGYINGAKGYPYDPTKAKALLAQAGYPKGFSFTAITAVFGGFGTVAKAVAGQLAKVGITMNVDTESQAPTWIGKIASKKFPVGVQGNGTYPPYLECQNILLPGAPPVVNPFQSTAPELEKLCSQLASAPASQQDAIGQQLSQWAIDNAWFAPVTYSSRAYFAASNIGGVAVDPINGIANPLDFYQIG